MRTAKDQLRHVLMQLAKLENIKKNLEESVDTMSETQWSGEIATITCIKENVTSTLKMYSDGKNVELLARRVQKRKQKRNYLKRKLQKFQLKKLEMLKVREEKEKKINEFLEREKIRNEEAKVCAEKKSQQLADVTHKIDDAHNYISLLMSMQLQRAACDSTSTANYNSNDTDTDELLQRWKSTLHKYELEAQNIKSELDYLTFSLEDSWRQALFGTTSKSTGKKLKIREFIDIRRSWDTHLVPSDTKFGSQIPVGWVMPNDNPTTTWSSYRIL